MRRILALVLFCILPLLQSCDHQGLAVTDNSFEFSADVHVDEVTLRSKITLTLEKGCTEQKYSMAFVIDGDPSLCLTSLTGSSESEKLTASFEDFPSCSWLLPVLDEGKHAIVFKIRSDSYTQDLTVPFEISVAPFSIHAEVSTPSSSSVTTLILNLVSGIADREYTGIITVDGREIDSEGFKVNFAKTPTMMIEIPLVRPGEHHIGITVNDGRRTEVVSVRYDEPLRHPDLDIYIAHHRESGKTRLMVHDNPYGLSLSVKDSLFVKGRCDYHLATYQEQVENRTDFHETCAGVTLDRFVPEDGRWYDLVDKDATEAKITGMTRKCTEWDKVWRTDSEGYWDYFVIDGPTVHFIITSSRQEIQADIERMQGVTVHVHCTEPGCIFNGKELSDEEYSFNL